MDEKAFFLASLALALAGWGYWYWLNAFPRRLARARLERGLILLAPPLCILGLWLALRFLGHAEVKDASHYQYFYMVVGAGLLAGLASLLPFFGLSARDDVTERGNRAAACAIVGALAGLSLCIAGALSGRKSWYDMVAATLVASALWFLLWTLVEWLTSRADVITIGRDLGAALRWGACLAALGLVLGFAVAGRDQEPTLRSFAVLIWPALVLAGGETILALLTAPSRRLPVSPLWLAGIIPGGAYLLAAGAYVALHFRTHL